MGHSHCSTMLYITLWTTRTVPPCCISPYGPLTLSHHAVYHPMDHCTVPPCCISPYGPLALSHHAVYHPMDHSHCPTMLYITLWTTVLSHHAVYHPMGHSHCPTMLYITLWTTHTVPPCCISPYGPLALSHHAVYYPMGHYCTENIIQHSLSCQDKKYHQYLLITFSHIF